MTAPLYFSSRPHATTESGRVGGLGRDHGRLYTTGLAEGNEKDALAGWVLFRCGPAACVAPAREAMATEERPPGNMPSLPGFPPWRGSSATVKGQDRTERHQKNILHYYFAPWAQVLHTKTLRQLRLQDLQRALNRRYDAEAGVIRHTTSVATFLRMMAVVPLAV